MSFRIVSRGMLSVVGGIAALAAVLGVSGCAATPPNGTRVGRASADGTTPRATSGVERLTTSAASALTAWSDGRERISRAAVLRAAPAVGYLADVLGAQRFEVVRWPAHERAPLRVWIAGGAAVPGWRTEFSAMVRSAIGEWTAVGLPLRVEYVRDSARAEVRVVWVERFAADVSGRTTWQYDEGGNIRSSRTTLSTRRGDGRERTDLQLRAIALHEIGHALGLQHAGSDSTSIMTSHVNTFGLSASDRSTVRLLYSLPPGILR